MQGHVFFSLDFLFITSIQPEFWVIYFENYMANSANCLLTEASM